MNKANSKCLKCGGDSLLLFNDHCTRPSCDNYDPTVAPPEAQYNIRGIDMAAGPSCTVMIGSTPVETVGTPVITSKHIHSDGIIRDKLRRQEFKEGDRVRNIAAGDRRFHHLGIVQSTEIHYCQVKYDGDNYWEHWRPDFLELVEGKDDMLQPRFKKGDKVYYRLTQHLKHNSQLEGILTIVESKMVASQSDHISYSVTNSAGERVEWYIEDVFEACGEAFRKFEVGEIVGSVTKQQSSSLYEIKSFCGEGLGAISDRTEFLYDVELLRDCHEEINNDKISFKKQSEDSFRKITENELWEWRTQETKDVTEKMDAFIKAMKS